MSSLVRHITVAWFLSEVLVSWSSGSGPCLIDTGLGPFELSFLWLSSFLICCSSLVDVIIGLIEHQLLGWNLVETRIVTFFMSLSLLVLLIIWIFFGISIWIKKHIYHFWVSAKFISYVIFVSCMTAIRRLINLRLISSVINLIWLITCDSLSIAHPSRSLGDHSWGFYYYLLFQTIIWKSDVEIMSWIVFSMHFRWLQCFNSRWPNKVFIIWYYTSIPETKGWVSPRMILFITISVLDIGSYNILLLCLIHDVNVLMKTWICLLIVSSSKRSFLNRSLLSMVLYPTSCNIRTHHSLIDSIIL
jgi:hypothetical protein